MNTVGFDAMIAELDALERKIEAAAVRGLKKGAALVQTDAQATTSYAGQSGATRASTVAYVATTTDDGSAAFDAAYNRAAGQLAGFKGHRGGVARESVGTVNPNEIILVLTVPTNYIDKIEIQLGGAKAFIGPTLDAHAAGLIALVAQEIASELS